MLVRLIAINGAEYETNPLDNTILDAGAIRVVTDDSTRIFVFESYHRPRTPVFREVKSLLLHRSALMEIVR